jgi:predicted secreted protein
MSLGTSLAIYLIVWWVVLLSILPLGVTSHFEAGIPTPGGGDPGSPVDPKLKRKLITTTWVSVVVFAPIWIAAHFHWISLAMLRTGG